MAKFYVYDPDEILEDHPQIGSVFATVKAWITENQPEISEAGAAAFAGFIEEGLSSGHISIAMAQYYIPEYLRIAEEPKGWDN